MIVHRNIKSAAPTDTPAGQQHTLQVEGCSFPVVVAGEGPAVLRARARTRHGRLERAVRPPPGPPPVIGPDGTYWLAYCQLPAAGADLAIATCAGADGTDDLNWSEDDLAPQCTRVHDMTIDAAGRMSVLLGRLTGNSTYAFEHVRCEAGDCSDAANWTSASTIANTGFSDPGGDLATFDERGYAFLDFNASTLHHCLDCGPVMPPLTYPIPAADLVNRGRIEASGAGGLRLLTDEVGGSLKYQVCDSGCDAAGAWRSAEGLPEADDAFDLELLPSGLPTILSGGGSMPGDLVYSVGRPQ